MQKKYFSKCDCKFFLFYKKGFKLIFFVNYMETLGNEKSQNNRKKYDCKKCYYFTSNKYDFEKHNKTTKHIDTCLSIKSSDLTINLSQKSQEKIFACKNCNKKYKDNSGLWRHNNKGNCINNSENISLYETKEPTDKDLILLLINENKEFKQLLLEVCKEKDEYKTMMIKVLENGTTNTNSHNTHTNSHNKAFNLNFFLNETCKDAMNIMDFVDSIKLQLSDLERVGELGYVEGISNIIVKNLKELDVTQRPVHCTDKKRETIYVKDEDKWEKDEEKTKMHKLVKKVADKNARMLPEFKKEHPDYNKSSSKTSDQFNKIIIESMGGPGDNDYEKEEKIIKKVSKEVTVEKEHDSL